MIRAIRRSEGKVINRAPDGIAGEHITVEGVRTSLFRYSPSRLRIADFLEERVHWMQIQKGMVGKYSTETLEILAKRSVLQRKGLSPALQKELLWDIQRVKAGKYVQSLIK